MSKKNKNKEKKTNRRKGILSELEPYLFFIFLPYLLGALLCLALIIVPQYMRKHSVKTWGVIREATEPEYHSSYDSEKKEYKRYYTTTLTVEYVDPDTGEKATCNVKASESKKERLPQVGTEMKISILKLGDRQIEMPAPANWVYYFFSIVGVTTMITLIFFFVRGIREELL